MGFGKFIGTIRLNQYRKITEENLLKTQNFVTKNTHIESQALLLTLDCVQILFINSYDLFLLSYNYCAAKRNWDKIFYGRVMAVCLTDFFDKIFAIIGKDLVSELTGIISEEELSKLRETTKNISTIRKQIDKELQRIRNITIAHKSTSGSHLYENIMSIDHHLVFENSQKIIGFMTTLQSQLTIILKRFYEQRNIINGT